MAPCDPPPAGDVPRSGGRLLSGRREPPRHELPPPPFPVGNESLRLAIVLEEMQGLARERVWALAPWFVHVRT